MDRVFLLENSSKIGKPRILYCIAKLYGVWSFRSCFGRFGILKGNYISCLKLWNKQYVLSYLESDFIKSIQREQKSLQILNQRQELAD